ncbi:hypothetical protein B0H14DRAFT_3048698 [Mycena olivaceomarginata]|nr:hypothetical protein B0H14DRAFT_3048698 [Mycena olivaceomarginata]
MDKLPDELLDRICSFLGKHELWEVVQLSTRFRRLAMLPYLSRFGISQATIQSGTLALSDSFFLILVVARINPIQRFVCLQDVAVSGSNLRYRKLTSILAVTAPIPDIVIYNRFYMFQRPRRLKETVYMLSRIPSSATSTLVVVKGSSTYLSRPRSVPPIRWKPLIRPLGSFNLSPPVKIFILGIPMLFVYLDTGRPSFNGWMRIQSLPEKQLTLVTLTDKRWPTLVLRPVPGLTASMYSSLLASLDLGMHLEHLIVEPHTNLDHAELMAFLKRHRHLSTVLFEPGSIRPSSLAPKPVAVVPTAENQVKVLIAPAPYIPHLLPAAPNAQRISLLFAAAPKHIPGLRGTTFDLSAYRAALSAIAALPAPPPPAQPDPIALTLAFRLTAASLPWSFLPSPSSPPSQFEAGLDPALFPERRLTRTHTLSLAHHPPPPPPPASLRRFRAPDLAHPAFLRWLGLFPALQHMSFASRSVEKIPAGERAGLAAGICEACGGRVRAGDVAFNVADD